MRDEMVDIFIQAPNVAKETFTRMLQEDGIDHTAKYLYIFGKMIIFELLGDPNLSRSLYELSEYFHKAGCRLSWWADFSELWVNVDRRMRNSQKSSRPGRAAHFL